MTHVALVVEVVVVVMGVVVVVVVVALSSLAIILGKGLKIRSLPPHLVCLFF